MNKIKSCPFCMMEDHSCDEYPKIIFLDGFTFVSCGYCGADGPRISSTGKDCEQRAIEAWNEAEINQSRMKDIIEKIKKELLQLKKERKIAAEKRNVPQEKFLDGWMSGLRQAKKIIESEGE